ncbi:cytochrome c oxidase (ba3-type) subunit II [Aeropyrum pernix K1]|uniref:Cytochrome c oxidase (Ba3-type) subunit II n=1 Tax=Aeropyrum pernix (strain ATCC 700893 / DSM 11879 / JCM 9820 / NBRC 100138 / K1) TaxID=272557 RepID=Q9YB77_AERPE|nr:cytochrome c oxidase subunit II [Aeropyrum pernix]BAA80721.1 cytochrome c oxidase (ba3-type) subunit II [Aeropyrum pernix K1]
MARNGLVYEYMFIAIIVAVLAGFISSLAYYSYALNVNPACEAIKADQQALEDIMQKAQTTPVVEKAEGVYEVYIVGRQFVWIPSTIVLEDPKQVTFYVATSDVIHGFEIAGTNVNFMVIPGYIAKFTWYPPKNAEGEYLILCNEYCGVGHQFMKATLIIERSQQALSTSGNSAPEILEYIAGLLSSTTGLALIPPS